MQPTDAHNGQLLDTVYAYAGHIDKQTLELAPTSQVVSWEQTAPDEWIYNLRPGVTFHNGDKWNAEAFQVYAQFAGDPASGVGAYAHTGPYTVEVVDGLTARVKCGAPCPIFARAMNIVQVHAPSDLKEKDFFEIRLGVGVGPYRSRTGS
jgi:peptide/nickel transport system substrate-binding protein